ncbi:unnamed protein product, partial [Dibothriocephalus latus]
MNIINEATFYVPFSSQVHGKRYAYKFDFTGLAQAMQPTACDAPDSTVPLTLPSFMAGSPYLPGVA